MFVACIIHLGVCVGGGYVGVCVCVFPTSEYSCSHPAHENLHLEESWGTCDLNGCPFH